jgi:hypothetical protein
LDVLWLWNLNSGSFFKETMERVQYEQEQMVPELKDLVQRGIFTVVRV